MNKLILNSWAKLNLYLEVIGKRRDNYHNIKTVFERIDLSDKVILESRQDKKIKITCNNPDVPCNRSNFAYQSAKLLQDKFDLGRGADIKIIKHIPVGSGLGGGSSNAASVLLGLNKLWNLGLSQDQLVILAKRIGCDVPFFLYDTAFALGEGRGDEIKPLNLQGVRPLWHILVVPKVKVKTPRIYKEWDKFKNLKLTKAGQGANIKTLVLTKDSLPLLLRFLFNSLEQVTARLYPEVNRVRLRLSSLGAQSILMSGSGPAVFGIVSSRKEALSLARHLKRERRRWQVFVTRTH